MTTKTIPYMRGMNFGFAAPRGWYGSDEALAQIPKMKALNIDWVAAHVTYVMETYSSTRVYLDPVFTPGDAEVIRWVRAAREAGLKVMLKPILEPLDGIWRGLVSPPGDGVSTFAKHHASFDNYSRWKKSFKAVLANYADLAQEASVDCLCLGAEYMEMEKPGFTAMWEEIIADTRKRYHGLLTYEFTPRWLPMRRYEFTPDGPVKASKPALGSWWSKLDFLGFSCYGDSTAENPTVEEFAKGFESRKKEAAELAAEFGLPLALLETGRRSTRGLKGNAFDFTHPGVYDAEIQSRYMEGVHLAFQGEPWYRGSFWWKWDEHQVEQRAHYYTDPAGDQGFTIDGKPALETLKRIYSK